MSLHDSINTLASFLAHEQIPSLEGHAPVDCIVLCASAILYQAQQVFSVISARPSLAKRLILVGGIGHSTNHIYEAVAKHPVYSSLANKVTGLPEARVLELILKRFFDVDRMTSQGCKILIEDKSTNCGANASETRKILEADASAQYPAPRLVVVVQDPTMARRTIASFDKVYEDVPTNDRPSFLSCPIFGPKIQEVDGELQYANTGLNSAELWEKQRFYELLVGEIPRLKDTEHGYGPAGKGFIVHVDVPEEAVSAAEVLRLSFRVER
jgi:uncharacterized SAM-binding protein YcdF (DUF218 family)